MSVPTATRRQLATYATIPALLLVALVASRMQGRAAGSSDLPLRRIPQQQGPWTCESEQVFADDAGVEIDRTYKHPDGHEALVVLKGTRTRLGTLKDYAVGRVGQGFVAASKETWQTRLPDGAPMTASVQDLVNGPYHEACIMWFVSPSRQCSSLVEAQAAGWSERLWARREPWFELHIKVWAPDKRKAAIEPAKELAVRLAGGLKEVVTAVSSGQDSGSGGATTVGDTSDRNRSSSDRLDRGE